MRSQVPAAIGLINGVAANQMLERLEARRFAATSRPRKSLSEADTSPTSRHIPAPVRRAVRERDGNQCHYVDASGRRCGERDRLEYHHLHPFGLGGDHRPEGIRLVCHAHNIYMAEHDYGRAGSWQSGSWEAGCRTSPAQSWGALNVSHDAGSPLRRPWRSQRTRMSADPCVQDSGAV